MYHVKVDYYLSDSLFTGGCDSTLKAHGENRLMPMVSGALAAAANGEQEEAESYDYDLIVIGGGSGGLASAKVSRTA